MRWNGKAVCRIYGIGAGLTASREEVARRIRGLSILEKGMWMHVLIHCYRHLRTAEMTIGGIIWLAIHHG